MASHYVFNSNSWFSAVSDYCLQLSVYLKGADDFDVVVAAPVASPMHQKCLSQDLTTTVLKMHGLLGIIAIWRFLNQSLKHIKNTDIFYKNEATVIWVFEGREHFACALHQYFRRSCWANTHLVRIRGQAVDTSKSQLQLKLSRWLYKHCDVVFAAKVIQDHLPHNNNAQLVCHYGRNPTLSTYPSQLPPVLPDYWNKMFTYLIVGRYDPIKGHKELLTAFCQTTFSKPTQLICIGESQNVSAQNLADHAAKCMNLPCVTLSGVPLTVTFQKGNTSITIVDGRVSNIFNLMAAADCGIICSVGSEVICRVAVEFLQSGTPLISSKVGALPEILLGGPVLFYDTQHPLGDTLLLAQTQFHKNESIERQCIDFATSRYSHGVYGSLMATLKSRWTKAV